MLAAGGGIAFLFQRLSVQSLERARLLSATDVAESISRRLAIGLPPKNVLDRVLSEYVDTNSEIVAASVLVRSENGGTERLSAAGMSSNQLAEQSEALRQGATVARIVEQGGERFWSVAVPITKERTAVGAVGVWSTLQAVTILTEETRRLALIVLPASLAALVVLLSLVFRHEVHGPMGALQTAMARAEQGDLTAEAPVARSDEIGFIARQYNRMLARIRETQEEREDLLRRAQGFNEELSKTVEQATSQLKTRNEELRRVNEELYFLQRRLGTIERRSVAQQTSARLAHKIGTPLNLISGHVQILKKSRPDDRELQEKLGLVQSQVEKLTDTVRDILDETRASLRREPLVLDQLIDTMGALLAPALDARGVILELRLASRPSRIEGVEDQLEQVFLTLINNSLDAMPEGGHLTVATSNEPGGTIRIRIQDDGVGIPDSALPHIFRPFFTTKEGERGTGLGLAIVQEILTAHRAAIHVESTEGQGTTFTIDIPRIQDDRR